MPEGLAPPDPCSVTELEPSSESLVRHVGRVALGPNVTAALVTYGVYTLMSWEVA